MHSTLTALLALAALQPTVQAVRFWSCGTADVTFFKDVNCTADSRLVNPDEDQMPGGVCYEPGASK
jgi:hypothetical protein